MPSQITEQWTEGYKYTQQAKNPKQGNKQPHEIQTDHLYLDAPDNNINAPENNNICTEAEY